MIFSIIKECYFVNYEFKISRGKEKMYEWKEQIPYYVGIIVVNVERRSKWVAKRPAPMEVSAGMKFMLRQSLIRTLFYQNDKLKKNSAAKIEQICQETEK